MDRNTIIGLVLVAAILFGWTWYGGKQEEKRREIAREQFVQDSLANPGKYAPLPERTGAEAERAALHNEYERRVAEEQERSLAAQIENLGESLVGAREGEEMTYVLENNVMKVSISSRGGKVANVELKDYKRYGREENVKLFDRNSAGFDMTFFIRKSYNYAQVNTSEYLFESEYPQLIVADNADRTLSLRLPVDPEQGAYVEYLYTIRPDEYMVDFDVRFVNMRELTSNLTDFSIDWSATSLQNEKGFKNENNYTTIAVRHPEARKLELLGMSEASKRGKQSSKVEWISFKQQHFSSVFIADDTFTDVDYGYDTYKEGSGKIKDFSANMLVPYYPNQDLYKFHFYFGPNHYQTMKQYDRKLEKVIPLGGSMISWINTGFYIPVMNWLRKYISSFGIIILILTLMVKIIILPMTYKSYMSSAKMKALKPEIDAINERYKGQGQDEMMKKQQATMALYKQYGVSPMGGCLPSIIQLPIVFALFRFFPASIELRGESFLWADDLSAYDSILDLPFKIPMYGDHISLFALLMATTMFFYSRMNYKQTAAQGGQQMAGMKFVMLYMMPVMMLLVLNNFASGLSYYYTVSQLMTIAIMWGFKYFTNEEKLRAKMEAKAQSIAANNTTKKKGGGFQQRYEEALRQQQAMQRQQQQKAQGGSVKAHTAKPQATNLQPAKKRKK